MRAETASSKIDHRTRVAAVMAGAAMLVFLLAPRATPGLLALMLGAMLVAAPLPTLADWPRRPPLQILVLLALALWGLVTVVWAVDRVEAVGKVVLLGVFALAAWITAVQLPAVPNDRLAEIGRAVIIAFALAVGFLLLEEATGHAIKRSLYTILPWTRPPARHIGVDNDIVSSIEGYSTNRNMAALSLALWPLLLAASVLAQKHRQLILPVLFCAAAAAIVLSVHDTSLLAILAAGLVFALMRATPKIVLPLVAAAWITATLLVVPITSWAHGSAQLHMASWLPHTARQRIILWGYTAEQVAKRPLLGVGVASTKPLDDRRGAKVETPPGYSYQWRSGPHAHNVFLQTWYELGAIGALLLSAAGLTILRGVQLLAPSLRPTAAAAFVSAAITAAFTWGMWQAWFMAAFAMSALICLLAIELSRRSVEKPAQVV